MPIVRVCENEGQLLDTRISRLCRTVDDTLAPTFHSISERRGNSELPDCCVFCAFCVWPGSLILVGE